MFTYNLRQFQNTLAVSNQEPCLAFSLVPPERVLAQINIAIGNYIIKNLSTDMEAPATEYSIQRSFSLTLTKIQSQKSAQFNQTQVKHILSQEECLHSSMPFSGLKTLVWRKFNLQNHGYALDRLIPDRDSERQNVEQNGLMRFSPGPNS